MAVEVELLGEGRADLVDERQLGGALVRLREEALRLVEEARVLEGHAHARRERREQADVAIVKGIVLQALERDDAEDAIAGKDGHAEPRLGFEPVRETRPRPMLSSSVRSRSGWPDG